GQMGRVVRRLSSHSYARSRLRVGRPLGARVRARAGQPRLFAAGRFSGDEPLDVRVGIDRAGAVRRQPTGIDGWPIDAPDLTAQESEQRRLLRAMVRRVGDASHHDPRTAVDRIEEGDVPGPPRVVLFSQPREPSAGIVRVALDEGQPSFPLGQRRTAEVDVEHGPEPPIFALALMDHVLMNGPVTVEPWVRADVEIPIPEHAPHVERLQPLARVCLDEKRIDHDVLLWRHSWPTRLLDVSDQDQPPFFAPVGLDELRGELDETKLLAPFGALENSRAFRHRRRTGLRTGGDSP